MKLPKFFRCYAKKDPDYWHAVCIDLNLVATGDNFEQAKNKLHAQIIDYLEDALTVDFQYIDQLVPRKAPFSFIIEYHWIKSVININKTFHLTNNYINKINSYLEPIRLRVAV